MSHLYNFRLTNYLQCGWWYSWRYPSVRMCTCIASNSMSIAHIWAQIPADGAAVRGVGFTAVWHVCSQQGHRVSNFSCRLKDSKSQTKIVYHTGRQTDTSCRAWFCERATELVCDHGSIRQLPSLFMPNLTLSLTQERSTSIWRI